MPERFVMSAVGKCAYFCCKEFLLNVCWGRGSLPWRVCKKKAAELRFTKVSDEYLSSLLNESTPKSTKKSTKYGMKIFNGRNA